MAKHWKKPETKLCKCGAVFDRNGSTTDKTWKEMKNCPSCRGKRASKRDRQDHHGGHTIHPLIDKFLYACKPIG